MRKKKSANESGERTATIESPTDDVFLFERTFWRPASRRRRHHELFCFLSVFAALYGRQTPRVSSSTTTSSAQRRRKGRGRRNRSFRARNGKVFFFLKSEHTREAKRVFFFVGALFLPTHSVSICRRKAFVFRKVDLHSSPAPLSKLHLPLLSNPLSFL